MCEKLLSISIASYNVAQFLENTVGSVIQDKDLHNKIEVIIVNDGSSDNTIEIAKDLQAKYPDTVVVIDKPNGGYGSTINASLQIARGKYYRLLDGDDWFNSEVLGSYINFLDEADADIVLSPYYECYETTNKRVINDRHIEIGKTTTAISEAQIANLFFAMHEIAIKTEVLKKMNRPIEEHCFYTDAEYVCYCLTSADTMSRFEQPVYCYRLGVEGQSVSISGMRKHYKDLPKVAKKIFDCYESYSDSFTGQKSEILKYCVKSISYNTYRIYMLLEKPMKYRKELIMFDREFKESFPKAYSLSGESKVIKLLRTTRFRPYLLLCKYMMVKFTKEIQA